MPSFGKMFAAGAAGYLGGALAGGAFKDRPDPTGNNQTSENFAPVQHGPTALGGNDPAGTAALDALVMQNTGPDAVEPAPTSVATTTTTAKRGSGQTRGITPAPTVVATPAAAPALRTESYANKDAFLADRAPSGLANQQVQPSLVRAATNPMDRVRRNTALAQQRDQVAAQLANPNAVGIPSSLRRADGGKVKSMADGGKVSSGCSPRSFPKKGK